MAEKYKRGYFELNITTKTVEIVECPDCGFEYNAEHSNDEDKKIYECPICELEEKERAIKFAVNHLKSSNIGQIKMVVKALNEVIES